ncbi:NAD-dependent epimerase/dehydratase family protein [bacterium]|nr:NAD-dependent epimerase/dehydratase family protein [bacterium]
MPMIDKTKPVLVTGATGYVAGWLVKLLLEDGLTVNAAVRDPNNQKKIQHLVDIANASSGTIRFFKSDLLEDGSYAEAMEGCELVYHTASPFSTSVEDPVKQLIEPAVNGTRNVLEQANRTEAVKRVVLTSSCAAIYGDNADVHRAPNGILTEEVWNTSSTSTHQPYSYSKVSAEKEAWKIAGEQSRWDLVVINPSFVMGPSMNPKQTTSESFQLVKQLGDGTLKSGVPRMGIGVVDVREVAFAHMKAGFLPEAEGRHILSGHNSSFYGLAQALLPTFGDRYPIPKRALPKSLVWLLGPMINKALTRKTVSLNVDVAFKADNTKSREKLGVEYRPLEESMRDMFQQMIDEGLL